MRMLWVMRHANAGATTDAKDDDERGLDADGLKQAKAAGIALMRLKTPIQGCFTSSLVRCSQTAEIVCEQLGLKAPTVEKALDGPPVEIKFLKALIKSVGNTLIVTHSPSCNMIIYKLTGAQAQLARGGLCQIHEGEIWQLFSAAACLTMADMVDFKDPQEADHRSVDPSRADRAIAPEPKPWFAL